MTETIQKITIQIFALIVMFLAGVATGVLLIGNTPDVSSKKETARKSEQSEPENENKKQPDAPKEHRNNNEQSVSRNALVTNGQFIKGLYHRKLNLKDPREVFEYVFTRLKDHVMVFPGESFFYFKFPAHGEMIAGTIALYPRSRQLGYVSFGYHDVDVETPKTGVFQNTQGFSRSKRFSAEDGVVLKKIDDWTYRITYEGKTVTFHLYSKGMNPPPDSKLRTEEEYIGPVFDESGMQFHLIFSNKVDHIFMVLDEDGFVPGRFKSLPDVHDNLMLEERTGFVFYRDAENQRKILVGVKGEHSLRNNWYDGPFDQMPDNYIKAGKIPGYKDYIVAAYPDAEGKIDKYGNYLNQPGFRVSVDPYTVYFSMEDLSFVRKCESDQPSRPELYKCLTKRRTNYPGEETNDKKK